MEPQVRWEVNLKVVNEINCTEHWTVKSKRHKSQQRFIRLLFARDKKGIPFPCIVKFTRLSPRMYDDDSIATAFKFIRDELSELLIPEKAGFYINKKGKAVPIKGRADNDPRIKWEYAQEKSKRTLIRVEFWPIKLLPQDDIAHEDSQ